MNSKRVRQINNASYCNGTIVYWMSREHRVHDNWALVYAQELAKEKKTHVTVVFCLRKEFPYATERLITFMLGGLKVVEKNLREKNIPFYLLLGDPEKEIPEFMQEQKAGALISDFHPLRPFCAWREEIADVINVPMYEVDNRNIVPCWIASPKQEFAAYSFRPKIHRFLKEFLEGYPEVLVQKNSPMPKQVDFEAIKLQIDVDTSVQEVDWLMPGEKTAQMMMRDFITNRLATYVQNRNDPTKNGQSHLSTYLHFGYISSQRIALEVMKHKNEQKSEEAFLEELIVRRELSDNYCYYNKNYDNPKGYPDWAKKSHEEHIYDKREYIYSKEILEKVETHDDLWNAAMAQAVKTGIMHGYLRMYWAKKIFEWSKSPEIAQATAIHFMDKYFLDGRETNGFTGIAWSMGGVHDRAWFERPVFGKIRYMNYNGAKKKFDINQYISRVNGS